MNSKGSVLNNIKEDTKEYIRMELDEMKLAAAERLSIASSKVMGAVVVGALLSIALLIFVAAAVVALAQVVGMLYSLLIVGGSILLMALIVWAMWGKFMVNAMVAFYCKLIFDGDERAK